MGSHSVTCHPTEVRISPLLPAEAGTRFSDPGGMQGWVDLCYVKATGRELNPQPVNRKSNALPLSHHATHATSPELKVVIDQFPPSRKRQRGCDNFMSTSVKMNWPFPTQLPSSGEKPLWITDTSFIPVKCLSIHYYYYYKICIAHKFKRRRRVTSETLQDITNDIGKSLDLPSERLSVWCS